MSICHGESHRTATPSEEKARCRKAFCRLMTKRKKTTFMSAVSVTYFFQAKECLNLSTAIAYPVGIIVAALFLGIFLWREWAGHKNDVKLSADT